MLAFPSMIVNHAKEAGMAVPEDPDNFDKNEFPHFHVFCNLQLGRELVMWEEPWTNARIIADVSEDEIRTIALAELIKRGFIYP